MLPLKDNVMLFLWIFGNNIEDALGRGRFLIWYRAAGRPTVPTSRYPV